LSRVFIKPKSTIGSDKQINQAEKAFIFSAIGGPLVFVAFFGVNDGTDFYLL